MIAIIVLVITLLIFLWLTVVIGGAVIRKQPLLGKPPIPVFFFILAKMLVLVNLAFLVLRGLEIEVCRILEPRLWIDLTAIALLSAGFVLVVLSTVRLKKDLTFGLSSEESHRLQTNGIYSFSRHPFYLGFLCILLSSCLLTPHYLNIASFLGAWLIHHFIMIREEEFLISKYGDEYREYMKRAGRYFTLWKRTQDERKTQN